MRKLMRPWRYARWKTQSYDLVTLFVEIEVLDNCGVCVVLFRGLYSVCRALRAGMLQNGGIIFENSTRAYPEFFKSVAFCYSLQFISLKQGILGL